MINKQIILEHCKQFFQYRIEYHGGLCNSGWGNQDRPGWSERCVLGALVPSRCYSIRDEVVKLLSKSWHVDEEFYELIMRFNDHHSIKELTASKIDEFLSMLAGKYGLDYDPIEQEITVGENIRHKILV